MAIINLGIKKTCYSNRDRMAIKKAVPINFTFSDFFRLLVSFCIPRSMSSPYKMLKNPKMKGNFIIRPQNMEDSTRNNQFIQIMGTHPTLTNHLPYKPESSQISPQNNSSITVYILLTERMLAMLRLILKSPCHDPTVVSRLKVDFYPATIQQL